MNTILKHMRAREQRYNHQKYWQMREKLIKKSRGICRVWLLYRIKRCDAFNCASFGTNLIKSAEFKSPPSLPHGLNGIIVSHNAVVGHNVTILHQVTIGEGNGGAPTIGDNVFIGAGAKIFGGITIGNNVKIGGGCIITSDIPDNCTVVMPKPIIIHHDDDKRSKQHAK